MNLESLGNRSRLSQPQEPKDTVRLRRTKARAQPHLEHSDKCRGGVCEVMWKPLGGQQQHISNASAQ
jgi:hypothetical protein